MERVNLEWLLRRATSYERWRAPIDTRLRHAVVLSGISIVATLLTLWALPILAPLAQSAFFLVLRPQFSAILNIIFHFRPLVAVLNGTSAGVFLALIIITRGLRTGRAIWHWVGFGEVAVGVVNGFVLALTLAIVVINLALWLLMGAFVVGLLLGILRRPSR